MDCDNRVKIHLGYEDECVSEKYRSQVNFTTNKVGGEPNWHGTDIDSQPRCKLCGFHQILALQLYAPLDHSKHHRTLYIFACINPNCWNQDHSWTCWRVQSLEPDDKTNASVQENVTAPSTTSWLSDADDWGDNLNDNEKNGNNFIALDPPKCQLFNSKAINEDLRDEFFGLNVDDPNANSPSVDSPIGVGAVGKLDSPGASAEIDGDEGEIVCIDTPTQPQCNLFSLLNETTEPPIPFEKHSEIKCSFLEKFIYVEEEDNGSQDIPQHVRDLLIEYQENNPDSLTKTVSDSGGIKVKTETEKYEKGIPMHGDETFHNFLCCIQKNPGQLLRYSRDNSAPLLLYPISKSIGRCKNCGGQMIFEIQILPTIIPKLILIPQNDKNFQLEFGTILIYTCLKSCWTLDEELIEEQVIVQAERF